MNLGRLSINQPILAMVLSIVLLIVGALAYTTLPVSEYPQVVPPTVVVTTQYPGASAQTVSDTVAAPIEQEINGVEDMLYLYSQATSNGQLTITVTFKLGTDLDKAQVLVQNRVAIAQPRLPEEVQRNGVTTRKNSPDILMVVFMLSPDDTFDQLHRTLEGPEAVRGHPDQGRLGRPHGAPARRRPYRARCSRVLHQQLPAAQIGGRDAGDAAAGIERARNREEHFGHDDEAEGELSERPRLQYRLQPDRVHCAVRP
jgi:hypothetical protein